MCKIIFLLAICSSIIAEAQTIAGPGSGLNRPAAAPTTLALGGTVTAATLLDFTTSTTANFAIKKGTANYFLLTNAGFTGIGTATPTTLFSLGSNLANSKLAIWDNGTTLRSGLGWQTGQLKFHLSATTDKFSFLGAEAATTDLMTILGTGNVGIGVVAPAQKLEVLGTIKSTGLILTTGTPAVNKFLTSTDGVGTATWSTTLNTANGGTGLNSVATGALLLGTGTTPMTPLLLPATAGSYVLTTTGVAATPIWSSTSTLPSNDWGLTGNTNATAASFIGTAAATDIDVKFRRNGVFSGIITNLIQRNTSFGLESFNETSTGTYNTAFGTRTLTFNTTGYDNTALGVLSLNKNTTGLWNTGLGRNTLAFNIDGNFNTATGVNAMLYNISGSSNTAAGTASLRSNTTGSFNCGFGPSSLFNNTTGNYNSSFGYNSNTSVNNLNNATAIGANAYVSQSNSLILGSISGVNSATDNVNVGIGTTAPTAQLHTTGTVKLAGLAINATAPRVLVSDVDGNIGFKDAATIGGSASQWTTGTNNISYSTGLVLIGTAINPSPADAGLKLAVSGSINAKKVKVTQLGWADYVFAPNYKLPTLTEVEKFIQANKHLPSVLSAAEVEKNGIDLGDNQATLLQKIEELTLYAIDANKKIEQQQAQINLLLKQAEQIKLLQEAVKKMQTNK
jgi:hypothetical protein